MRPLKIVQRSARTSSRTARSVHSSLKPVRLMHRSKDVQTGVLSLRGRMRVLKSALFVLGTFIVLIPSLHAGPLFVTTGGTFSGSTPTTSWSLPNATWTLSFDVDSNPTVTQFSSGALLFFTPTNVVYTLNGSLVSGPIAVEFLNSADGGGFELCFASLACAGGNSFTARGAQYYTGSESAPTINTVTASAYTDSFFCGSGVDCAFQPDGIITIATPEPASVEITGAALLGLALWRRRKRMVS